MESSPASEEEQESPVEDALVLSPSPSPPPLPPSWLEIRLFYVRISPCTPDSVPPHLNLSHLRGGDVEIEINGCRVPPPDPTTLPLRRDRVNHDTAEVSYISTDGVRLSGAASIEVSDDRGNLIISGVLERAETGDGAAPGTAWRMDCSIDSAIGSSVLVQPNTVSPAIEVYVAGCSEGSPVTLTQTVRLASKRKADRSGSLDSIPENGDGPVKERRTEEGSHRRGRKSSSSAAVESFHTNPQSQPYMGQTYPYQFVAHPQHNPQFSLPTSQMQSQFQPPMLQYSYQVPMIPHPHYQPVLNSQYGNMQPRKQSPLLDQEQSQSQEQFHSQSQTTKRGTPNKRWKPHYDDFLIPFLVEQAREGMKVDKNFKRQAFVAAAIAVNDRFHESFTWENVDNHMRTLKTKYQEIKKFKELNGASWNDELKMITLDEATYQICIEANPKAKDYINKPIENYEGLSIICGDDPVKGYRKKTSQKFSAGKINMASKALDGIVVDQHLVVHDEEVEAPMVGSTCTEQRPITPHGPDHAPLRAPASPSISRNGRASGRRPRENIEAVIMELVRKVADVADAINSARPTHWTAELYDKVMDLDEFEAAIQEAAFDTLRLDETEARAFIVKNKMMRHSWMKRFIVERFTEQA